MSTLAHARRALWTSAPYRLGRRALAVSTRPLRRLEVATVWRRDLSLPIPELKASRPIEIRHATFEEATGTVAVMRDPRRPATEEYARRMRAGFICWTGWVDGELAAYNWTQLTRDEEDGYLLDLRPGEAHMFDAFTAEKWRGIGIHGEMNAAMLRDLQERGYRYSYSRAVAVLQRRSPKALRKLGWETTGLMALVRRSSGAPVLTLRGSSHPWRRLPRG